jgi:hypothetical protein
MRTVHLIVIHCSATKENETLTEIELEKSHRQRGLNGIGYHYYIRRDGNIFDSQRASAFRISYYESESGSYKRDDNGKYMGNR